MRDSSIFPPNNGEFCSKICLESKFRLLSMGDFVNSISHCVYFLHKAVKHCFRSLYC